MSSIFYVVVYLSLLFKVRLFLFSLLGCSQFLRVSCLLCFLFSALLYSSACRLPSMRLYKYGHTRLCRSFTYLDRVYNVRCGVQIHLYMSVSFYSALFKIFSFLTVLAFLKRNQFTINKNVYFYISIFSSRVYKSIFVFGFVEGE